MKAARIIVLGVAVIAGGLAALLASRPEKKEAPPPPVARIDTVEVLVAKADIGIGHAITEPELGWQLWPTSSAGQFIRKTDRPDAIEQLAGSIVRTSFAAGEPIRDTKLIKAGGAGYLAAVLPQGMRAISVEISPETGAGGFILPNDHVDVILSRQDREAERAGTPAHVSEIILMNVRVLAIDQTVEEKGGQKVVVGKTATLALSPSQTETLALARQMGTLSLALRSIVDTQGDATEPNADGFGNRRSGISVVRFGISKTSTPK